MFPRYKESKVYKEMLAYNFKNTDRKKDSETNSDYKKLIEVFIHILKRT
jgi:hypothetical protein